MQKVKTKASFWRRILAGLVDFACLVFVYLLTFYLLVILPGFTSWKFYFWLIFVVFSTIFYRIFLVFWLKKSPGQFLFKLELNFSNEKLSSKQKLLILLKREIFLSLNWLTCLVISAILLDLNFGLQQKIWHFSAKNLQNLNLWQQISLSFLTLFAKVNFFILVVNNLSIFNKTRLSLVDRFSKSIVFYWEKAVEKVQISAEKANFAPVFWKERN
ncbi:RDD family protein [Mycoplasma sp. 'Moose RK']|uniref:RDD family protein n=1 Tax=Mycoplasma sp. 'Moose RK' TaxID=2780095 RepID=UPI0018C24283|nr:RDD family protein [Mycoplasma sp. 'Moose RK']MBG0730875.1 RDD family protein [Mycoplasma sp. 'Moose RK']